MRDAIDQANDLAQREIDNILAKRQKVFVGESAINCFECGELIPEKRRKLLAGCKFCVDCQEVREYQLKNR